MAATGELALIYQSDYSDAWLSVMQRRYHMRQRSPLTFWMLLAATLAVDVVVVSLIGSRAFAGYLLLAMAYDALIVSQLSVLCIWAFLSSKTIRWLPILIGPIAAALIATVFSDYPANLAIPFKLYLSMYGLVVAVLAVALWIFRSTRYWRRRTGVEREWRYSVAQLLVAMTAVAVLIVAMRNGPFYGDEAVLSILFVSGSAVLAIWSVIVWSSSFHWFIRLAGVVGLALLVAASFWPTGNDGQVMSIVFGFHFLVQAIVLSAWLALGPLLPPRVAVDEQDAEVATPAL